jgi:prevent-host-death family protein
MKTEVGVYEAKTRLAELLRAVKAGGSFTITNRGEAVAELGPPRALKATEPKAAIDRFLAFKKANPPTVRSDIRSLIEQGRE